MNSFIVAHCRSVRTAGIQAEDKRLSPSFDLPALEWLVGPESHAATYGVDQ